MEHKKDLAKIALAALVLISANPVNGQADQNPEAAGIFLATGCPAHGCPSKSSGSSSKNDVADNATGSSDTNYKRNSSYQTSSAGVTNSTSSATLTETQLLDVLSPQGKAIYLSLDPEGKSLAIQLASQDSYQDKNLAVKDAQRRMNDRRGLINR